MTDQELRELVRESIAKQLADGWRGPSGPAERERSPSGPGEGWRGPSGPAKASPIQIHASHGVYAIAREDENGPCVIEPSVPCTHCNYCKSHGH